MTKVFRYIEQRDILVDENAGKGVSQVVEADVPHTVLLKHLREAERDISRCQEVAQLVRAHIIVVSYLTEKNRKGELGFSYETIRGYNVYNSKIDRYIELDGLAKGIGKAKNRLLVVECKYRTKKLSLSVLEHMKESLSVFPAEFYDIYLFSKSVFADDILALNDPLVHLISVVDMSK